MAGLCVGRQRRPRYNVSPEIQITGPISIGHVWVPCGLRRMSSPNGSIPNMIISSTSLTFDLKWGGHFW